MIYFTLFTEFFKIALFTFGGGYAMIPLIQNSVESMGWMTLKEFYDILAIAEVTPGPLAINTATFVGYEQGGLLGGLIATVGVIMPSLIIILCICIYFLKYMNHPIKKSIFFFLRPTVVGMIFAASFSLIDVSFFDGKLLTSITGGVFPRIDFMTVALTLIAVILGIKTKLHPILLILICGVLGIILL